jgi:hypothetical protein|eukprot:COSAG01_NODE_2018_length_8636_cov_3.178400_4_plen_41_part_00
MRDDIALEGRRAHDFAKFAPEVAPGQPIATRLNPRLGQPS